VTAAVAALVLAGPAVRAIADSKVSPGVLGFLVVAALGVATWLLIRSMNRQMRKVDFDEDAVELARRTPAGSDPVDGPVGGAADGSAATTAEGDDGTERRPG
jgi:hypothetical protein